MRTQYNPAQRYIEHVSQDTMFSIHLDQLEESNYGVLRQANIKKCLTHLNYPSNYLLVYLAQLQE